MRTNQNGDILLEGVLVPASAQLPGAESFRSTAKVLAASRVAISWMPVGMCMGIYDMTLRYVMQRTQSPLAAFQVG